MRNASDNAQIRFLGLLIKKLTLCKGMSLKSHMWALMRLKIKKADSGESAIYFLA